MPLYEYQCQECGEKMEAIQRFDDPPYTICASCGGVLKKLFSSPAIQFKGSGFYSTDYGKGGGSAAKPSSTGESSGDSSSTSKPAAPAGNGGTGSKSD
jgi:putative FmdB family regulatory protein